MRSHLITKRHEAGFTLVEVLVVAGIIALLLAIAVPALTGAFQTSNMTKSMVRLKQVATYMQSYASENRETIVPSQFDYTTSAANFPVKVRSDADLSAAERYRGTWTDILWTYSGLGEQQALIDPTQTANTDKYLYDSPDRAVYESDSDFDASPFRSSASNSKDFATGNGTPLPFGPPFGNTTVGGATESGLSGYFAANNFFNLDPDSNPATPQVWYVTGQIKSPDRSVYVVDSLAGETIDPDPAAAGPWDNPLAQQNGVLPPTASNLQVDFRYNGVCLMLFLDGHSDAQAPWRDLGDLESRGNRVKVRNLTQN